MTQIGFNQNRIQNNQAPATSSVTRCVIPQMPQGNKLGANGADKPSFKGATAPTYSIRTELTTQEEKEKYSAVVSNLSPEGRREMDLLLKSGRLLNNDSNDKSTSLDSLYKIISTPRASGLTPQVVLNETVKAIANPFTITQKLGNIPKQYMDEITKVAKANPRATGSVIDEKSININDSNACVSASIEFNLALKSPAEFARFSEGLTSPKVAVDKTIDLKNLTDNTLDSVWLLNNFEIPYEMHDFDKAKLTLAPDKNAILRAQIQNNDKDKGERSVVDVLMQSTFMNVASQQSYDSLTDVRGGKFNDDNRGLIEFEKTFTESIVQDKNKISVTYQILDEDQKLTGYTTDFATMQKHILDSLGIGQNVIIGYISYVKNGDLQHPDPSKKPDAQLPMGHEITIIGAVKDKKGELVFLCNDTDDNNPNPIAYPASYILPKIHHAGLPQEVVAKDANFEDGWREGLKAYKESKNATGKTPENKLQ